MAQRLQFTYDIFRGMCWLNNTDLGIMFRSIWDKIYNWIEPELSDKLSGMYLAIKPYIEDDTERHKNYIKSKVSSWKLWWLAKASKSVKTNKWSIVAKLAKLAPDNDYDYYSIYNSINIIEVTKEFPNKNIEVEFKKMWNYWEAKWKQIKKPNQAFKNWLLPKKREKEYKQWTVARTDQEFIEEMILNKNDFYQKYWKEKYKEIYDKWLLSCTKK